MISISALPPQADYFAERIEIRNPETGELIDELLTVEALFTNRDRSIRSEDPLEVVAQILAKKGA